MGPWWLHGGTRELGGVDCVWIWRGGATSVSRQSVHAGRRRSRARHEAMAAQRDVGSPPPLPAPECFSLSRGLVVFRSDEATWKGRKGLSMSLTAAGFGGCRLQRIPWWRRVM